MKNIYKISFLLLAIILANNALAQVGGNDTPMQYSRHTYVVTMEEEENTPLWQIYEGHFEVGDIESGDADGSLLTRNTDYRVVSENINDFDATIVIEFDGSMDHDPGLYTIAYRETNAETCFITEVLKINMQPPFDIDVDLASTELAADCPDLSNLFTDDPENPVYQTEITYEVTMVNPDSEDGFYSGNFWAFNYSISATGRDDGNSSGVASVHITYGGGTYSPSVSGNPSVYENSLIVDNSDASNRISVVTFTVTFNDALGATQDIVFEISEIEGAYNEKDIDPFNKVERVIYAMPDVGQISALN